MSKGSAIHPSNLNKFIVPPPVSTKNVPPKVASVPRNSVTIGINRHAPPIPKPQPPAQDMTKVTHIDDDHVSDVSYTEQEKHGLDLTQHLPTSTILGAPVTADSHATTTSPYLPPDVQATLNDHPQAQITITSATTTSAPLVQGNVKPQPANIPGHVDTGAFNKFVPPANPTPIPGEDSEHYQNNYATSTRDMYRREHGNRGADVNADPQAHDPIHSVGAGYADGQIKVDTQPAKPEDHSTLILEMALGGIAVALVLIFLAIKYIG